MRILTAVILGIILALSANLAVSQDSRDIGTNQANVSQILQSAVAQQSASTQINQGASGVSAPVTQVANASQIFSINKAEAMDITAINNVGGQWIEIANIGMSNRNLTRWRLTNQEGTVYVFPNIIIPTNSIVRVHQGSGQNTLTDLYTYNTKTLVSGPNEVITLADDSGRLIDTYQSSQPTAALAQDLTPPTAEITTGPAAFPQPEAGTVYVSQPEGTTGIAMPAA